MKGYKPEVTKQQHAKFEIFKGKVKSEIGVLFSNKQSINTEKTVL
jgi:hypothetical protein